MKTPSRFRGFTVLCLLSSVIFFSGCVSSDTQSTVTPAWGETVQVFGPPIAQIAQERLALRLLEKNPTSEGALLAFAATLQSIETDATGREITETAIRAFVARVGKKYALTASERELIVTGLLLARDELLRQTGDLSLKLGDPRVTPWIAAIRQGIESGVAEYRAKHPPTPPAEPIQEGPFGKPLSQSPD